MLVVPPIELGEIISPDGRRKLVRPKQKQFTLEELRTHVDAALIELVPLPGGYFLVIDEEGKLAGKEHNAYATAVARRLRAIFPGDYIAGTALLCSAHLIA